MSGNAEGLREPLGCGSYALVGGREGNADERGSRGAVEVPGGDQDPALGEPPRVSRAGSSRVAHR